MCKHIVLLLPNRPGQFSKTATILKNKDVNILGYCLTSEGRPGLLYLLCKPHELAFKLLREEYSYYCSENEVVIIEAENKVGNLEPILSALSENEINLPNSYQSPSTRGTALIVLEFNKIQDFNKAREILKDKGYNILSELPE